MSDQKKYTNKLSGQHVLVVGGSGGIGYGVAEGALEHGASVSISSSQKSRIDAAIASLQKAYPSAKDRVKGYACDLSKEADLEQNVAELLKQVGTVDHIVYTAGDKLAHKPFEEASFSDLKQAGMVRFFAPFLLVKTAYANKHIKPGPSSSVTLTTGTISQRPRMGWSIPAAYAGGQHSMTRQLALEMKPIRVNLISPGAIDTPLWDVLSKEQRENLYNDLSSKMPTGRVGQVEHLVNAYLFVMQDHNCTGSVIDSNSGALLV